MGCAEKAKKLRAAKQQGEKKPCGGCQERKLLSAERKLGSSSDKRLQSMVEPAEQRTHALAVVIFAEEMIRLIGPVTGIDYGPNNRGCVIMMDQRDIEADKRVARATHETMRLVL